MRDGQELTVFLGVSLTQEPLTLVYPELQIKHCEDDRQDEQFAEQVTSSPPSHGVR